MNGMSYTSAVKISRVRKGGLRLLFVILLLWFAPSQVGAQRHERIVGAWKPMHYDVAISFNDQLTEISSAQTEITVRVLAVSLTVIDLDFSDLPVDSVAVSGQPAAFERKPELLDVMLP